MRRSKIIVVGAGPAGGTCALTLARAGVEVLVLDKSKYPRTKVCGSGLSPNALRAVDRLGLRPVLAPLHLHMRGVTVVGPDGTRVRLRGQKGAWVVPRSELDHAIVGAAQRSGARFQEETKVTALVRDGAGRVRGVQTSHGELEADLVVCANGSPSRFEVDHTPRYGILTLMGWWKGAHLEVPDEGLMIWDERLDGYYAWLFPEPGGVVNIGLTVPEHSPHAKHLKALFQELLDDHFAEALRTAEPVGKWMGHPATLTTRVGPIAEARALWCGEAARLVCPASVEGIGFAMRSGMAAGRLIAQALDPAVGLTPAQRARYRLTMATRFLPTFWAGEAFVRFIRSRTARRLVSRVVDPQWLSERAASLVGESS
ncbi:MAG: NAD(P)/FAD-dependent oxidoreductase [Myxococcales bacterium]|nr:NAD(P)/FAD-dependent oxidoreductase [Myxococcales bacterium]